MKTQDLIREIQKLPVKKRMYVVERTMHMIRKHEEFDQLMIAAEGLHEEYSTNKELTAFTTLDMDDFYETR